MPKLFLILVLISLTENRLPWLNVAVILLFAPLYLLSDAKPVINPDFTPTSTLRWVKAAYVFWLLSYLLTRAPISNLFSFDFLRRDGALLFAYLPLIIISDYGLDRKFLEKAVGIYLTLMSALAILGVLSYLETFGNISLSTAILPEDLQVIFNTPSAGYEFHGLYEAHNAAGAVYGLACCISLCLLVFAEKRKLWSLPSFWFSATFVGLMLSKSRTSYIAFAATALMFFAMKSGHRRTMLRMMIFLLLPLSYFLVAQSDVFQRAQAVDDSDDPNIVSRWVGFQRAFDDFVASPIIGIGFGRYNDDYLTFSGTEHLFYVATGGQVINESSHAHDSYLHFLAEGGLIGFGLMMAIWVSAYRWAKKTQVYFKENTFPSAFAAAIQACIIFEFCISFTEHSMGTAVTSLTIFTMFGVLRNLVGSASAERTSSVQYPVRFRPSTA